MPFPPFPLVRDLLDDRPRGTLRQYRQRVFLPLNVTCSTARAVQAGAVFTLLGCGHTAPPAAIDPQDFEVPFSTGVPVRLTYDTGIDGFASLSPDGTFLLYSFQPRDRADNDRCIGMLPISGGTRTEFCDQSGVGASRTDALEYPAVNSRGDLLYARYASAIGDLIPNTAETSLQLGTLRDPLAARVILQLPTTIEGIGMTRIGTIRWADNQTFYFVAEEMTLTRNPITFSFRDTVITGRGLIRGRIGSAGVAFEAVSGVLDASGFDFSARRDSIFYTRSGDNRLYAVAIDGSVSDVVHVSPESFDQPRQLRDPARSGEHVIAVSQDIDVSTPPRYPAGLAPNARLEAIRTGDGTSTVSLSATRTFPSFGRTVAIPGSCRIVVEYRSQQSASFTTDLYSICRSGEIACDCT